MLNNASTHAAILWTYLPVWPTRETGTLAMRASAIYVSHGVRVLNEIACEKHANGLRALLTTAGCPE